MRTMYVQAENMVHENCVGCFNIRTSAMSRIDWYIVHQCTLYCINTYKNLNPRVKTISKCKKNNYWRNTEGHNLNLRTYDTSRVRSVKPSISHLGC